MTTHPSAPDLRDSRAFCALAVALALGTPAFAGSLFAAKSPAVIIVLISPNCLVPDVAVDAKGVVHMVYGLDHHAHYARATDQGATFSPPVRIDSEGQVETKMGERGPKLTVGSDGVIHVAWMDEWAPGVKTFARYSRSLDAGKTFAPAQAVSSMSGIDGVTATADGRGHVAAFWHVMADPKPAVKAATWLYTARSSDNGATFGPSEKIKITGHSGLACSMCMMRARTDAEGRVFLVFRSAEASVRDFFVLTGPIAENNFTAQLVNHDDWTIDYCPMCGPELTLTPDGGALCAFMSRKKVYWAAADKTSAEWRLHVATPASEENEIYPTAVANRRGDVLFLWQIGLMATKGNATVQWACYDRAGHPSGATGTAGRSFAGTKATAFAGADDNFYIVTTAVSAAGR